MQYKRRALRFVGTGRGDGEGYSQTVRRETIEAQFATILRSMQRSENVFAAARAMFKTLWSRRLSGQVETRRTLETERSTIERQVEHFSTASPIKRAVLKLAFAGHLPIEMARRVMLKHRHA